MPTSKYAQYKPSIILVALVFVPIVIIGCVFIAALGCSEFWTSDRRPSLFLRFRSRRQTVDQALDNSRRNSSDMPPEEAV
ncbi:hypothetical protein FE257_010563 [Aspergillus nanangensis]|uniref:Uncharacterized protein n=1 Tax=Aspergillus nanangensis TaxID=2582783 RepID=A0AAD4GR55_ASPNN|nr:hypothetical protein FE257_010563 [Aspergillus nanangensis]